MADRPQGRKRNITGAADTELISSLLESFLGGGYSAINGLTGDNTGYYSAGREVMEDDALTEYLSGAWVAIEGQPVAYYRMDTTQDGDSAVRTGYVSALFNGDRVNLMTLGDGALRICYRFTDIYHKAYWSAPIMK
ncbi:hypothetical protein [Lachnoclostridium sp. Marseille-P6806]|uniref:hypothetical protein n=1 Tax=Lachnoclostridium sp. Marseille-P6806 TaxID=2364793 RepID=UPI001031A05C|nr:hypothetical protein [Lachnoclostridium sp. Marseille-P6806]